MTAGQVSGGSGTNLARFEVRFAPAPPPEARAIDIRLERFEGWAQELGEAEVAGP